MTSVGWYVTENPRSQTFAVTWASSRDQTSCSDRFLLSVAGRVPSSVPAFAQPQLRSCAGNTDFTGHHPFWPKVDITLGLVSRLV